jgi:hypothetical protein
MWAVQADALVYSMARAPSSIENPLDRQRLNCQCANNGANWVSSYLKHYADTPMNASILKYLRSNGEQLDADISLALDIPMAQLKSAVAELSASGDVICCKVTRFIDGKKIEGTSCRLSCDLPAPARGRKPGVKKDPNADTKYPE